MAICSLNLQNCRGPSAPPNIICPISKEGCPFNKSGFARPQFNEALGNFSNSLKRAANQFSNDNELLAAIIQLQEVVNTRLTD